MNSKNQLAGYTGSVVQLPPPLQEGGLTIEEALARRRSVRDFSDQSLSLAEISRLLWAAQGITGGEGKRTAPSAGALYPLEIYLAAFLVEGLDAGVYHYLTGSHRLQDLEKGDKRFQLSVAALMQGAIRHCAAVLVIAADYRRTTKKYFERGKKYVHMEAGHVAQNVLLLATALHIGSVPMGAFMNGPVRKILHVPKNEEVLYLLPLGKY